MAIPDNPVRSTHSQQQLGFCLKKGKYGPLEDSKTVKKTIGLFCCTWYAHMGPKHCWRKTWAQIIYLTVWLLHLARLLLW